MDKTPSQSASTAAPPLPCPVIELVAQRPPMLVAGHLVFRDRPGNFSVITATVPPAGVFVGGDGRVIPEYLMELMAQSMASVNGFDALTDGDATKRGVLVGIDSFTWHGGVEVGEELRVEVVKTFEFGPVTVAAGKVLDRCGAVIAEGEIKAWDLP